MSGAIGAGAFGDGDGDGDVATDRCARCGTPFRCGVDTERCWCAELPPLPVLPAWGGADASSSGGPRPPGCLCPRCLQAALVSAGRLTR